MNPFSFQDIFQSLKDTILRFPLPAVFAVFGTFLAIALIHFDFEANADYSYLYNLLITSVLGFLGFVSLQFLVERLSSSKKQISLIFGGFGVFLLAYFFLLPASWEQAYSEDFLRVFLLAFALFISISFSGFLSPANAQGFWQFNKTLFIRSFFAGLYTLILFIGLAVAYVSLNELLGFDVPDKLYAETFIFLLGIFSTYFILSGIPRNITILDKAIEYPKGIKFFAQYILSPLMALYAIILTLYLGEIVITQEWPEGMVTWLVLLFSSAGIVVHVLLSPLKETESIWTKYFSKLFFVLEIPFLVMGATAIFIRLQSYGLTESRYYVVLLILWFLGLTLYFLFSKTKDIRNIAISLFTLTLLSSFGPWGAVELSKSQQLNRAENVLIKYNILVDGKVQKLEEGLDKKESRDVSASMEYLIDSHGLETVQPWFEVDLKEAIEVLKEEDKKENSCWRDACYVMQLMGVKYIDYWEIFQYLNEDQTWFSYYTKSEQVIDVEGFSAFVNLYLHAGEEQDDRLKFMFKKDEYQMFLRSQKQELVFLKNEEEWKLFSLQEIIQNLQENYSGMRDENIPESEMMLEDKDLKILIKNLGLEKKDTGLFLSNVDLQIFFQ